MNDDVVFYIRLGITFCVGIIALLVKSVKSGPDPKIAKQWEDEPYSKRSNFRSIYRADGSLREHSKTVFYAFLFFILIYSWITPFTLNNR